MATPRMTLRRRSLVATLAALAVASAAPSGAAASQALPACTYVVPSPDFVHDNALVCAQMVFTPQATLTLFTSKNGGRSWRKAPAIGLTYTPTDAITSVPRFSPNYAKDHLLFVNTDTGVFASTDLADSFTVMDPNSKGQPYPYRGSAGRLGPILAGDRLFLASFGTPDLRLDYASGLKQPIVGGWDDPTAPISLVIPPDALSPTSPLLLAVQTATTSSGGQPPHTLWECTDDATCTSSRFTFDSRDRPEQFWRVRLAKGRTALVIRIRRQLAIGQTEVLLRSEDDGRTFVPFSSLQKLRDATISAGGRQVEVNLASHPRYPGVVLARIASQPATSTWAPKQLPAQQLFRSADGGATWTRVAYQLGIGQPGRPGTLPFNSAGYGRAPEAAPIVLTAEGRLLVPARFSGVVKGVDVDRSSVFCSTDLGRTWHLLCPR